MSAHPAVYLVDADPAAFARVGALLRSCSDGFCLIGGTAGDWASMEVLDDAGVDILLTDFRPLEQDALALDGVDLITRMKRLRPATRCVLMTGSPSPDLIVQALLAGADAVLVKPFSDDELLHAMRVSLTGQCVLCDGARQLLTDHLRTTLPSTPGVADDGLAPREIELLMLLDQNLLLKEAADRMDISIETARTYRKRIFAKLRVNKFGEARAKFFGGQKLAAPGPVNPGARDGRRS